MSDTDIKPSTTWTGDFTWDGLFLRRHIATVKTDYNSNDPCTWPLMQDVHQTENGLDYRKSRTALEHLAYKQSLIDDFIQYKSLKTHKHSTLPAPGKKRINKAFRNYPFNFDRDGELRKFPHIPKDELE